MVIFVKGGCWVKKVLLLSCFGWRVRVVPSAVVLIVRCAKLLICV
jgi:hypothetical protein